MLAVNDSYWTTRAIAGMVETTGLDAFSAAAIDRARDGLLDYLAVAYAGAGDPLVDEIRRALGGEGKGGRASCIGRKVASDSATAAVVNGFSSHVLDYDDMLSHMRGHPSGPVLSAVLALAEETGASGRDMLLAYMVAVDAVALAGRQVAVAVQEAGLHSTVILGSFGAALGCGKLLGLSADQLCAAAALALAQAGGPIANFGSPAKATQVGLSAAAGLRAAKLAAHGVGGPDSAIEDLWARYGKEEYAPAAIRNPIPSIWEAGELKLKRYASCSLTHQAIEGAKQLRAKNKDRQIESVRLLGSYRIANMLHYPIPKDRFEVKFSLPYCFAVASLFDEPLVEPLTPVSPDPLVLDLARRVTFEVHPQLQDFRAIGQEFMMIEVRYSGGRTEEVKISGLIELADRDELLAKARACFGADDGAARADRVIAEVENIDRSPGIGPLMAAVG